MLTALTASHGERSYTPASDHQKLYLSQAQASSEGLGFEGPEDMKLCTTLGYWLGGGFWKDPLYPWVSEMAVSNGALGVMNYAIRRLDRQLKPREGRNG